MNDLLHKLQQVVSELAKEAETEASNDLTRAPSKCETATEPGCECTAIPKPATCKTTDCTKDAELYGCFPLTDCTMDPAPKGCSVCDVTPQNPTPPAGCPSLTPTDPACPTDLVAAGDVTGCECIATPTLKECKDVDCATTPTADGCHPVDCKTQPDYFGCVDTGTGGTGGTGGSCGTGSCTLESGCQFMYVDNSCKYGQFDVLAFIKDNASTILNLAISGGNGSGGGTIAIDWSTVDASKLNWANFDFGALSVDTDWSKVDVAKLNWANFDWSKIDASKLNWATFDWSKVDFSKINLSNINIDLSKNPIILDLQAKVEGCCGSGGAAGGICGYVPWDGFLQDITIDIKPGNLEIKQGEIGASGGCTIPPYQAPANVRLVLSHDDSGNFSVEHVPALAII